MNAVELRRAHHLASAYQILPTDQRVRPEILRSYLGITFWRYLQDRIQGLHDIPPLAELIRRKAAELANP